MRKVSQSYYYRFFEQTNQSSCAASPHAWKEDRGPLVFQKYEEPQYHLQQPGSAAWLEAENNLNKQPADLLNTELNFEKINKTCRGVI